MTTQPVEDDALEDLGNGLVVVATLHPDTCSAVFMGCMTALMRYDVTHQRQIVGFIDEFASANISAPRNGIVKKFLEDHTDADWLWFVDSDMQFAPDILELLLSTSHPKLAPIVGGLCFGEANRVIFPTKYHLTKQEDGTVVTVRSSEYAKDALEPVDATGAACLLIHRSVLVAIREEHFNDVFPWFQESEIAGLPMGEDVTFCLRARQLGFPIWLNTAAKTGHHKSKIIDEDAFVNQFAPVPRPMAGRPILETPDGGSDD